MNLVKCILLSILEMTSIDENNPTMTSDDSDAPVEVTTKTSKMEKTKKKKKKGTKRRIKYTLATEGDDDDGEHQQPKGKRFDEESALTHLIFGDDDEYLEELTTVATTDKRVD